MTGVRAVIGTLLLLCCAGCQTAASPPLVTLRSAAPPNKIPHDVLRLAVVYPKTQEQDMKDAYLRLEGGVFGLKAQRPSLRLVERRELAPIVGEQWLHTAGRVSDETAVSLGRLLGADSVLLFRVEGPGWRERLLARIHGTMSPLSVVSKIVKVESAEVLYHDVVTCRVSAEWDSFESDVQVRHVVDAAIEQGVVQTIANLEEAFR